MELATLERGLGQMHVAKREGSSGSELRGMTLKKIAERRADTAEVLKNTTGMGGAVARSAAAARSASRCETLAEEELARWRRRKKRNGRRRRADEASD